MRKRLTAIATITALCSPLALLAADKDKEEEGVEFYGHVGYELQFLDDDISEADGLDWGAYLSRIGLRNSHAINDQLKATYQVESFILHGPSGDNIGFRNTYGGLKSESFGEVRVGRHDTPYKRANLPFFAGANMLFDNAQGSGTGLGQWNTALGKDTPQNGDFETIDRNRGFIAQRFQRWHGTLHYISPQVHGLTLEAAMRPVQENGGEDNWVDYSASLTYRLGESWMFNTAYESEGAIDDGGNGGSGVYQTWLAGALFTATDWLTVGAQIENLDIDVNSDINGDLMRLMVPIKLSFGDYYVNTFLKYDDFDYEHKPDENVTEDDDWFDIGMQAGYYLDPEHNTQVYAAAGSAEDIEAVNYAVGFRYQW
ncbi:outer membrane protein class 1 [Halorhodospira halochloris]|uniref:Outer membrane protein class 1 n=1 Tax=Halorhodospira halochloris TaxID=1052 RepID=A0A0X8XAG6_HALHR|nr:porin [Halorhodospira halochloris]MBK1651609.1 hypothetical protein [Halorhodospira halochloris]BAU58470.1 outer membrane protein class 1 [Halorhodospira halochloris]